MTELPFLEAKNHFESQAAKDAVAKIAKEAFTTRKTVREVALARKILAPEKLSKILDPWRMTEPGIPEKD
jgi:Aspartate ammonia-lyase